MIFVGFSEDNMSLFPNTNNFHCPVYTFVRSHGHAAYQDSPCRTYWNMPPVLALFIQYHVISFNINRKSIKYFPFMIILQFLVVRLSNFCFRKHDPGANAYCIKKCVTQQQLINISMHLILKHEFSAINNCFSDELFIVSRVAQCK